MNRMNSNLTNFMNKPRLISLSGNLEIGKTFGWDAAIFFNKLEYLEHQTKRKDGYCFRTAEEIEEELGIQDKRLRKIIKDLKDAGVIDVKNTYILGTTKKCRHFKILWDSDFIQFNILGKSDKSETSQRDESGTFQRDESVNSSINNSSINNNLSINIDKSSADATLADKSTQVQSAVDVDSSLSTIKNVYSGHSVKTQETVSIDKIAMLKKGNVFNPAAYALVDNLPKKLGSHEGKPSKKVLIALRSVITSNPKLVENNCDLFMKCAEQLALDDYQVNLGNNNVEFLLNHISKYLNLAVKGGVQTNSPSKESNRGAIFVKY